MIPTKEQANKEILDRLVAYKADLTNNRNAFIQGLTKRADSLQHALEFHSFEAAAEIEIKLDWVTTLLKQIDGDTSKVYLVLEQYRDDCTRKILDCRPTKPIKVAEVAAFQKLRNLFSRYIRTLDRAE